MVRDEIHLPIFCQAIPQDFNCSNFRVKCIGSRGRDIFVTIRWIRFMEYPIAILGGATFVPRNRSTVLS
jgi:hypothetical protein